MTGDSERAEHLTDVEGDAGRFRAVCLFDGCGWVARRWRNTYPAAAGDGAGHAFAAGLLTERLGTR